jgi:hypothetical protein
LTDRFKRLHSYDSVRTRLPGAESYLHNRHNALMQTITMRIVIEPMGYRYVIERVTLQRDPDPEMKHGGCTIYACYCKFIETSIAGTHDN